jgi:hypothetical protein
MLQPFGPRHRLAIWAVGFKPDAGLTVDLDPPPVRHAGRPSRRGVRSSRGIVRCIYRKGRAVPQFENPSEAPATITAVLEDGPLEGRRIEAEVVEGRPPKTIEVPADDGSTCRYCLADWVQTGRSAVYTFLYRV